MIHRTLTLGLIAGLCAVSFQASAVELTWSDGTTRIQTFIETKDYQGARDTWIILSRDYPNHDLLFELDMRFAVGDFRDASVLLTSLAYRDPVVLFNTKRPRVTQWSIFQLQLDALDYYVAEHAGDDKARLVLGYYLLLSGMPNRAERIFSRIHTNAPEWPVAQILLDVSQGRTPQYSQPPQNVIVTDPVQPPCCKDPIVKQPVASPKPRFTVRAGSGALVVSNDSQNPVPTFNGAIGIRNAKGYAYELQLLSAPQVAVIDNGTRKDVSIGSVGLGVSYMGSMPYRASLRPVGGFGVQLSTATPIGTETAKALSASARLGLELAIPVGKGALQLGIEGSAQKPLITDGTFPAKESFLLNVAPTLGITF